MAHDTTSVETPFARFESAPRGLMGASIAFILIGIAAFAGALINDADRAWHAYLFNWLFFLSIAQGSVIFAVMVTITRGAWSRNIRRIALAFVTYLPIAYLLMIPLFLGASHIFPWLHEPVPGKDAYLNIPFLVARNMIGLGILFTLAILFARKALRPDLGLMKAHAGKHAGLWNSLTAGWAGQEAEEMRSYRAIAKLGPAIAVFWAIALSVVAWDFVMSLEPHWFSTLLGPYYFMGGLLGGLAATAIATRAVTNRLGVAHVVEESHWHDLAKLTFGFVVFWAYLFFSQYIVIWYGLLPGEQQFVIHRFTAPYGLIAKLVFTFIWIIPFFGLLSATAKKRPHIFTLFCGLILVGLWLERYLLVYPSLHVGVESLPLGWQELGVGLMFLGLMLAALSWFLTRFPVFQAWQPVSEVELKGVPVEVGAA